MGAQVVPNSESNLAPKDLGGSWAPVAHTCNPSYSGDRDQEIHSLKLACANSFQDPISKKPKPKTNKKKTHKKGLMERLKV
jgi:hypothetical protein